MVTEVLQYLTWPILGDSKPNEWKQNSGACICVSGAQCIQRTSTTKYVLLGPGSPHIQVLSKLHLSGAPASTVYTCRYSAQLSAHRVNITNWKEALHCMHLTRPICLPLCSKCQTAHRATGKLHFVEWIRALGNLFNHMYCPQHVLHSATVQCWVLTAYSYTCPHTCLRDVVGFWSMYEDG